MVSTSSANDLNELNGKRLKLAGSRNENGGSKAEVEATSAAGDKPAEGNTNHSEPPKQDYIHVRGRRGQATDSHSLADRARREKISERMKILQDLVPGCNKVIGKALVLDEIINYIQSLQRQVEEVELEAVNSRMSLNPNIEGFPSKNFFLRFSVKEMEENGSTTILDGEIVGIRFSLATRHEICTASISDCPITHVTQLANPFLGLPLEFGKNWSLVELLNKGNAKAISDILNYQFQYIIPVMSVS